MAEPQHHPALVASHPDFLVVAKPAGLSFHGEGAETSLIDQVRELTGIQLLFPVHRLDRITSGLILLARQADAARELGALLAEGRMNKCYLALADKAPSKKQGGIKGGMVKGRGGSWRLTRGEGLSAVTQFFSYGLVGEGCPPGLRLFVLRPRTGRTHQLRVALKSLGSPILGDTRYGGTAADRGYLHAWSLSFVWRGEACHYQMPPNEGKFFALPACDAQLAALGDPWQLPWPGL